MLAVILSASGSPASLLVGVKAKDLEAPNQPPTLKTFSTKLSNHSSSPPKRVTPTRRKRSLPGNLKAFQKWGDIDAALRSSAKNFRQRLDKAHAS